MSPPPSSGYPSYNPAASGISDPSAPYPPPQDAYAGANEFAGGPDRRYQMPTSGGPPRGGMSARGGPPGAHPLPPPPGQNMNTPPPYGYTPASFESAPYGAPSSYDQSSAPPASYGQPPQQAPGYSQDYNPAGPPPRPPPAAFDGQGYGRQPPFGQGFRSDGPPQGSYGRQPLDEDTGFRGGRGGRGGRGVRGGGRGGRGGGGGGGGGGRFDDDEKPCRTIFVRSINFETDAEFVKQQFEQFGQIKTFFDMVNKRGIAFITYYDLRSARDAMLAMKGALFGGRPINIHYSLPREEDKAQRCDRDKNQGTLFTVLKGAQQDLDDDAVRQVFAEFGDLKKIRDYPGQKNSRFVEYFDSRACQLAHDQLNGRSHLDGQWDLKFAWDVVTDEDMEWAKAPQQAGGPGFQPGPPAAQSVRGGRAGGSDRGSSSADYGPPAGGETGLGYGRPPIPSTGAPVDNGWGRRAGSGSAAAGASAPPSAAAAGADAGDVNRLEQAQKVQQLLASLGAASKPPATAATSTPPPPSIASPPARSPPATHASAAGSAGLPPNIAALLQSAAGAPKPMQPPKPQSPPTSNAAAAGQESGQQSVHQLLSMLNQNRPPRPS
ncbi:hypothetical protein PHSY_006144 [Pseudozyma hubeiensis SY62]|uniref:RRM domain-containing protein n=1 Tax=Pseudozyma hubeiensis (strain SY62) TaxID=1305764 RepID=R9PKA4_PSEHS|nr:hypothetical protein PHSY_006144 [Pseudozyma hubeiensis SY62]GAC98550.1 hypothetical protein PHSY_006144 [Pseudozyma hubeiensis SY62]